MLAREQFLERGAALRKGAAGQDVGAIGEAVEGDEPAPGSLAKFVTRLAAG